MGHKKKYMLEDSPTLKLFVLFWYGILQMILCGSLSPIKLLDFLSYPRRRQKLGKTDKRAYPALFPFLDLQIFIFEVTVHFVRLS